MPALQTLLTKVRLLWRRPARLTESLWTLPSAANSPGRQRCILQSVRGESDTPDRRRDRATRQRVAQIHEAHENGMASLDECLNALFGNGVKPHVVLRVLGDAK